ncbi:bifunctional diguanylate cyclase/phosphodiesterase [Bacillus timonensis]|nr:bifunctional diguanylate cyclase/phosphodiesterase [Bacillus timonensis]
MIKSLKNRTIGFRIAIIYLLISVIWIISTDLILDTLKLSTYTWISITKGWIFVFINTVIIYKLVKYYFSQLQDSEKKHRNLLDHLHEASFIHIDGKVVSINKSGVKLLGGKSESEFIGKNLWEFVPVDQRENLMIRHKLVKEHGTTPPYTGRYNINGHHIYLESVSILTTFNNQPAVQVLIKDNTHRIVNEEKIKRMAFEDYKTGLPNSWALDQYFQSLQQPNDGFTHAMLFIDVDRLKHINDTLGHKAGDIMIKHISERLRKKLGSNFLARIGGDEFIAVIMNSTEEEIKSISRELLAFSKRPYHIEDFEVFTTFSIGIYYINKIVALEEAMKKSNQAMQRAKSQGKNTYTIHTESQPILKNRSLIIENKLRNAIKNEHLKLFYQPKVNMQTEEVIGVEALLRWYDDELGEISPVEFIPIAEETEIMKDICQYVIKTACSQKRKWMKKGFEHIVICINISPSSLLQENILSTLKDAIKENEINGELVGIEITENIPIKFWDTALLKLTEIKKLGVKVVLDDFGIGYSSLSYLKRLPLDFLKIDRLFVKDLLENNEDQAIVKAIIKIAHTLKLTVVAEGIETKEQFEYLRSVGCDEGQGFYFSKAFPPEEVEKNFKKRLTFNKPKS